MIKKEQITPLVSHLNKNEVNVCSNKYLMYIFSCFLHYIIMYKRLCTNRSQCLTATKTEKKKKKKKKKRLAELFLQLCTYKMNECQ